MIGFGAATEWVAMVRPCAVKGEWWLGGGCAKCVVEGARPEGRPEKTWTEIVQKDCQAHKSNREDAMNCSRWRKHIKDD